MGKRTPQLVVAVLIVAVLVVLALQNGATSLPLVFLGIQTLSLPLGVWLISAIAVGAVTAIAVVALASGGMLSAKSPNRRRWTVRPDPSPRDAGSEDTSRRNWGGRSPQPPPQTKSSPRDTPRNATAQEMPFSGRKPSSSPPSSAVAAEDWQAWEQRPSPSKWEDWSQAGGNDPIDENLSRRQRQDRQKAEATIHDLDKGWDDTAQDTVYVAPGGSDIEDALDDIVDGWEDWDTDDNPLSDTAYAQRYEGVERKTRRDAIYAPPDQGDAYEDWETPADDRDADDSDSGDDSVYDADYRVIIPPYRPLDEEGNEGDRPA